jgi:hypothetical protein
MKIRIVLKPFLCLRQTLEDALLETAAATKLKAKRFVFCIFPESYLSLDSDIAKGTTGGTAIGAIAGAAGSGGVAAIGGAVGGGIIGGFIGGIISGFTTRAVDAELKRHADAVAAITSRPRRSDANIPEGKDTGAHARTLSHSASTAPSDRTRVSLTSSTHSQPRSLHRTASLPTRPSLDSFANEREHGSGHSMLSVSGEADGFTGSVDLTTGGYRVDNPNKTRVMSEASQKRLEREQANARSVCLGRGSSLRRCYVHNIHEWI